MEKSFPPLNLSLRVLLSSRQIPKLEWGFAALNSWTSSSRDLLISFLGRPEEELGWASPARV